MKILLQMVRQMDFELIILLTFAEVVMDEHASDAIKALRIEALNKLQRGLNHYKHLGFLPRLTSAIAEKKCDWIKGATSKAEIEKFLKPRCPRYDGEKFIEDASIVPEEELICWSYASLRSPLNSIGPRDFRKFIRGFSQIIRKQVCSNNERDCI